MSGVIRDLLPIGAEATNNGNIYLVEYGQVSIVPKIYNLTFEEG